MLEVLVLARERQGSPCYDVLFSGFCGLVPIRVLRFPLVFGFCGFCFLSFFLSFSVLLSFLYTSCMLRSAFTLFIKFICLSKIKIKIVLG